MLVFVFPGMNGMVRIFQGQTKTALTNYNFFDYICDLFWPRRNHQLRLNECNNLNFRSFPCFAVRSFSAHKSKVIIFKRFHCSLTKIRQLNWQLVKLIGKLQISSIWTNFCKTRPMLPFCPFYQYFAQYLLNKHGDPLIFFAHSIDILMISVTWKNYKSPRSVEL